MGEQAKIVLAPEANISWPYASFVYDFLQKHYENIVEIPLFFKDYLTQG